MAEDFMSRIEKSDPAYGSIYHEKTILTFGSKIYKLPPQEIYSIAVNFDGDGTIEFTNDSYDEIDNGTPDWVEWDGAPEINNAVTGYKVTWNSGTVTAGITVKTTRS